MRNSPVKSVFFLKSGLLFNEFYCFYMFVNKHSTSFTGKLTREFLEVAEFSGDNFYMKTNIIDFQICIGVPLIIFLFQNKWWFETCDFLELHYFNIWNFKTSLLFHGHRLLQITAFEKFLQPLTVKDDQFFKISIK